MVVVGARGAGRTPSRAGASPAPASIFAVADHSFDWWDAGIGAAAVLGLVLGVAGLVAIHGTCKAQESGEPPGGGGPES
jgi:hypothetical protein